ncbi:MAG: class III signal peptide-containing protein [Atopobiaceae bacterium]|nr:class III signal peptide-containing protein [Atopobiaceae bacterium]
MTNTSEKCLRRTTNVMELLGEERGQGTTEYAILVGVLVVIAIIAIIAFRGKVQELWDAIVNGMNSL